MALLQPTLMRISKIPGKSQACYSQPNPLLYLKIWKQACIPCLLFGSELWNVTPSDIEKLEGCQRWFVRKVFYLLNHYDVFSLQSISGLTSIELQIDIRKFFFFARIVSNDGMSPVVRDIFRFGANEYFRNPACVPTGFMGETTQKI